MKFKDRLDEYQCENQPIWSIQDPVEWLTRSWNGEGMMIPACWLIPKKIIEKAGLWNEELTLHDDGEFMCRVLLASKGNLFCNDAVVYYRQVEGSLSRNNTSHPAALSALKVYQSYKVEMLKHADGETIRYALANNFARFLYEYYPRHKELCNRAFLELKDLKIKQTPKVGSSNFQKLMKLIGFNKALRIVSLLRRCK